MQTIELEIIERDGGDITFLVPWKGEYVKVKWEEPIGCLMGGFQFDMDDDDEYEEFEEFLWDAVDISTNVTMEMRSCNT